MKRSRRSRFAGFVVYPTSIHAGEPCLVGGLLRRSSNRRQRLILEEAGRHVRGMFAVRKTNTRRRVVVKLVIHLPPEGSARQLALIVQRALFLTIGVQARILSLKDNQCVRDALET